jgi:hypothetical protein
MFGGATSRLRTHAPRSWFLRLTIAGCLAAGLVASPVSAAPGWSRPVNVSGVVNIDEESPLVDVDSAGNATAVWRRYRGGKLIYESAVRQAGGPWSTPSRFFGGLEDAYGLQIAVDPLGNETAIWGRPVGRSWVVQSATRSSGGIWSAPVSISKAGHRHVQDPQIAVSPQGEATAIWQRSNGSYLVVQGATRPAGGGWSRPVDITTGHGRGGQHLQLVVDSWGNATAIWEGYDTRPGPNFAIQAAKHPPGGAWSRPTDISRWTKSLGEPQIAVDPQGRSTAIWAIGAKGGAVIQSATSVRR